MKKKIAYASLLVITLTACSKSGNTPETPVHEVVDTTATGTSLIYKGAFEKGPNNGDEASGNVNIYAANGAYTLALDSFSSVAGPDLHVYLSQEKEGIHFIDLGKLKSTTGSQLYNIPGTPDFTNYKFVLIYCQQYSVLFAAAELMDNM